MLEDFPTNPLLEHFVLIGIVSGLVAEKIYRDRIRLMSPVDSNSISVSISKDPARYSLLVDYEHSQLYVSNFEFDVQGEDVYIYLRDMANNDIGFVNLRVYES